MSVELLVLRAVHVLGGIFWVGSGLFTGLFLMPAVAGLGPAAGPVMAAMQARRLFVVLPVVAVLTILSGLRLLWISSGGLDARYFAAPTGATLAASGVAATLAFLLSLLFVRPAAAEAGRLAATLPGIADADARAAVAAKVARLQRRSATGSRVVLPLLVLGALGMSVARYLH